MTIIAGAAVINGEGYDNALVAISQAGGDIIYRERMPVPGSMWQPWRRWLGTSGGARAHFFANPVVDLAGARDAPLICYEQLAVWPVLQSMLSDPDFADLRPAIVEQFVAVVGSPDPLKAVVGPSLA